MGPFLFAFIARIVFFFCPESIVYFVFTFTFTLYQTKVNCGSYISKIIINSSLYQSKVPGVFILLHLYIFLFYYGKVLSLYYGKMLPYYHFTTIKCPEPLVYTTLTFSTLL